MSGEAEVLRNVVEKYQDVRRYWLFLEAFRKVLESRYKLCSELIWLKTEWGQHTAIIGAQIRAICILTPFTLRSRG